MTLQVAGQHIDPVTIGEIEYQRVRGVFVADDVELIRSSDFGILRPQFGSKIHTGQDLAVGLGTPAIWDAPDAVSFFSGGHFGGLGNAFGAVAEDDEGVDWLIMVGHLRDRPLIARGEPVRRGQQFGFVGTSGSSTGPHMHIMTARALDYDAAPGISEGDEEQDYVEFWRSVRDDDGGVSRLVNILDYLVDEVSPDLLPLWNPLPFPSAGSVTITQTRRAVTLEDFGLIAHGDGIMTLWAVQGGAFVGFIVGAPPHANQPFADAVLDGDDMVPAGTLIVAVA